MKRRKSITAGELLEQLSRDEDYQRRMAAQEAELAPFYAEVHADEGRAHPLERVEVDGAE